MLQSEDYDDVLFGFNVSVKSRGDTSGGQSGWDKEDEKVKKKLERLSINSIRFKYAQQQINQSKPEGGENIDTSLINIQADTSGATSPTKVART